ncbi:MAG: methyltransferase domain-containing protein [Phycisphaeraceae bacterium]|nr:methyltransferase domain-containing protein [Phycisphaeraceae bacterium]
MSRLEGDEAQAYAEASPQAHVEQLAPVIRRLLGPLGAATVLDFGAGPGALVSRVVPANAARLICVDRSEVLCRMAARRLRDRSTLVVVGDERVLPLEGCVDAALCSLVLMNCADRAALDRVCERLIGALRPGAPLVVALTHPCFRNQPYGTFRYELPSDYAYLRGGTPYHVILTPEGVKRPAAELTDHHWPLGDYVEALCRPGAVIDAVEELPATGDAEYAGVEPPAYLLLRVIRKR